MTDSTDRLLVFSLQRCRYALDIKDVAEVLEPPQIFPIPSAPLYFSGIMNFHGNLVSVLDLAHFLNDSTRNPNGKVLVLDTRIANLAIWVDMVETIVSAEVVLEEEPGSESFVERVLIMADGEVRMLSVDKLLERLEGNLSGKF
jgi:purine-binding chemotaxis protein CheW